MSLFARPSDIDYLKETRIQPTLSCPSGYTLIDNYCQMLPKMSCPPGYSISNGICVKTSTEEMAPQIPTEEMTPPSPTEEMTPPDMSTNNTMEPCPTGFERRGSDSMCYPIV